MDSVAADQIVEDSGIIDSNTLQTSKEDTSKLGIVNNREWYFQDISYEQIELILKQRKENTFLVTNATAPDQFVLYICIKSTSDDDTCELKAVTLDKNQHGDKCVYKFEGEEDEFPNVVEAVVSFVKRSEFDLVPAIAFRVTLRLESILSQGTVEVDLPPNYTAAANFPGVTKQLPVIEAKVDVEKGEDADTAIPPGRAVNINNNCLNCRIASPQYGDYHDQSGERWSTHVHYYQDLHCCHPKNTWHFCCHRGYDSYGLERSWYSIRGSGICRALCLLLFYCLVVVCFPFVGLVLLCRVLRKSLRA